MNDLTVEETVSMLYGIKLINGLSRSEQEILDAAIFYLEKGADDECRNDEGND